MNKIPVIVIAGPTAVGKTALSIEAALAVNGEIISGDAIQVYKEMDIGSAKVTEEEMNGVPHYLIDILNPDEPYSAAQFKKHAEPLIEEIYQRGKIPVIAGGTGLYVQSLITEYTFKEEDSVLKARYIEALNNRPVEEWHTLLNQIDPEAAEVIHPNNKQRIMRAIVYYQLHGVSITKQTKNQTDTGKYDTLMIGLNMPRPLLYDRINQRVDLMIEKGLVNEVEYLMNKGYKEAQSMTAIGYKEIIPHIEGEITLEEASEKLKQNSRHFAKRQLTWFNNQMNLNWFDTSELSMQRMVDFIKKKV